jgi:hypothetical protein
MFPFKRMLSIITFFTFLASPALADEIFSLKAGYITLNPSGDVALSANGLTGTSIDIDDDLGIDDGDDFFGEAALQLGDFRLFAAYLPIDLSGNNVLTRDINFNGEIFPAGSHVKSDLDIDIYEAGLAWFLINLDDAPVRIQFGPEVAVKYVDASVKLHDGTSGLSESESFGVPVPTVGARARVAVADYLGVVGRVGYMEYDSNSFLDVDVQVEFSPLPMVGLFGGYRYLDIDVDDSDLLIDATFSGPYVGALVRF